MSIGRRRFACLATLIASFLIACHQLPSDTAAEKKETVRKFFEALDTQDYDSLSELLAEDFVLGHKRIGRQGALEVIRGFYASFPDYTHVIEEMIAEGNRVAVRVTYHGTHWGDFRGLAATGKKVTYAGAQIITVADGVITEGWFLDDDLDLLTQLGMEIDLEE